MKSIFAIAVLNLTLLCALAQNFESNSIFPLRPSEERYLQQIAFVHRLRQQLQEQIRLRQPAQQPALQTSDTDVVEVSVPSTNRLRQPLLQQPLPDSERAFQFEESQNFELLQRQQEEQRRENERQRQLEEQQRELQRQEIKRQLEEQRRQRELEEQERQRALVEQQRLAADLERQEQERQRQIQQQRVFQNQQAEQQRQNFSRQFEVRDDGEVNIRTVRQEAAMTEVCLACICQASTNCNLATRCVSNGQYCGPFLISRPYWIDAGMPTLLGDNPSRPGAFEDCTADPVCSAQTVRTYMTKYAKDCNNDGRIDCDDLGRIHLMGSNACSSPSTTQTPFFQRFSQCVFKASNLN